MRNWSIWLWLISLPLTACAVSEPVQLKYPLDRPVRESSHWTTTIQSGGNLLQLYKKAQADLELKSDKGTSAIVTKPPFVLQVNLKGLQVGADGSHSAHFDSEAPEQSTGMQEISKALNIPVTLTIGDHLQISASSSDNYHEATQELSQLGGFQVDNLFSEMVQHLFALAGQDLHEGDKFRRQVVIPSGREPVTLEYQIVKITPQEIRAVVNGKVPSWTMQVKEGLVPAAGVDQPASMALTGTVSGKIVWSRSNALIYKTRIDYDYQGTLTVNERESPISIQLHHLDTTNRL